MKEFMFFIRKRSNSEKTLAPEKFKLFLKACEGYIENLKKNGKLISAKPFVLSGKIISGNPNKWKDSSFDDTKEIIAGYYHILAKDLTEATEIAKANPEFAFNADTRIEVRQVKVKEELTGFVYPSELSGKYM
jgi:hypothetical protein